MEDSVTTRVLVHECTLAGTTLVEEPFQRQGQGSAFVSRPNELVVVSVAPQGVPAIPQKVTQLVEKGFHSILVSLLGLRTLERDSLKLLLRARGYVENWAGFLRVCDLGPELMALVRSLGLEKDLNPQGSRSDAIEAWKREVQSPAAPAPSADGKLEVEWSSPGGTHLDLEMEVPKPASPQAAAEAKNLPQVDVAELVVPAEELPKLRRQVEAVLQRGKRYVTMRLSFKKRMRSEDVQLLTEARDILSQQGGQLVLASLQQDVATWLKLLDYDREFVIADDADQAELAHRRHAAGAPQARSTAPAPKGGSGTTAAMPAAKAFSIVSRTDSSFVVRSPQAAGPAAARLKGQLTVVEAERAGLPALVAEVERLSSSGVRDIVVDLKPLDPPKNERMEPLVEASALAQMKGVRLSFARVGRELRAYLKRLGLEGKLPLFDDLDRALLSHAERLYAQQRYDEIEITIARKKLGATSELVIPESSVSFEQTAEMSPGEGAEAELRIELQKAIGEVERQKRAAADAAKRIQALETALQQARSQAPRVVEKIVERRVEVPVEKVVEKRVEVPKIVEKVVEKVVERPVADTSEVRRLENDLAASAAQLDAMDQELAKTREKLDFVEARYRQADYARDELDKIAHSSDDARRRHEAEIEAAERARKQAESRAQKLEAELEAQARSFTSKIKELEQHAQKRGAAPSSDGGDQRAARLEREKAEILLESKREIERLTREQETLREELESAGEMIERLGKELELT